MYSCLYVDAFINSFASFNVISHNIIFWLFYVCMCVDVHSNNIKDILYEIYITLLWSLRAPWDYANCQGLFLKIWSECLWALINYLIYDKLLKALNFAYFVQGAVGGF